MPNLEYDPSNNLGKESGGLPGNFLEYVDTATQIIRGYTGTEVDDYVKTAERIVRTSSKFFRYDIKSFLFTVFNNFHNSTEEDVTIRKFSNYFAHWQRDRLNNLYLNAQSDETSRLIRQVEGYSMKTVSQELVKIELDSWKYARSLPNDSTKLMAETIAVRWGQVRILSTATLRAEKQSRGLIT